jgi:ArsR family transcriptional regulator, arsenate/arsenite/antimonite-responsive transcriptional repressor
MLTTTETSARDRVGGCCEDGLVAPLAPAAAEALSDDLTLLANPVRLQLLALLRAHAGQVCVCDLEAALPVKQPTVSHHLKLLRAAGLVEVERRGLWAYYSVRHEALAALRARIDAGLGGLA